MKCTIPSTSNKKWNTRCLLKVNSIFYLLICRINMESCIIPIASLLRLLILLILTYNATCMLLLQYWVVTLTDIITVAAEVKDTVTVVKRPRVSLMSSYRQTWKARNQHFTRYSDMKLKDERRPTVTDLANQKHIMQKVHGWKGFHLSAQIEEMVSFFSFSNYILSFCHQLIYK